MYSPYNDLDMTEGREEGQHQNMAHMTSQRGMSGMSPLGYTGRQHLQNRPQDFSHETLLQLSDTDTPSEESWPEDDPQRLPPERKRSSSPSIAFASPNKRHRNENATNGIHSFHKISDLRAVNNQRTRFDSIFARRPRADLITSSVDRSRRHMGHHTDEEAIDDIYTSAQPTFVHDDAAARFQNERERYARAQSQQPPRQQLRAQRSISRLRDNAFSQVEHQESSPYRARANIAERQELKIDQGRSSDLSNYRRFGSMVPENSSARVEQQRSARKLSQSYPVQPPSLGSAIWEGNMERPRDSTPAAKVIGKHMINSGLMAHPDCDLPRTPNNWRDREQSVAPRSSATPRREQSVAPHTPRNQQDRSTSYQTPISRRSQSRSFAMSSVVDQRHRSNSRHIHTPSFDNTRRSNPQTPQDLYEESGSDTSGTALEDFFRKPKRGSQRTVRASPFNAVPLGGMFSKAPRISQNPRPPLFQTRQPILKLRPEPEIIDLCSPVKSIPMKERIPAANPIFSNRPITKPNLLPQNKPKVEWKPKIENKVQNENSAEIERQRKLAEAILEREENARTAALQMEIFGEIVPEDKETKNRREEKERAENQRRREAVELEKATIQEQKRLAEVEKARQRAEAAEKARVAREAEEIKNKKRRDAKRVRQEAADALGRERLRQKAEEKIQADRLKKAAEDAEREREKQKANAVQAEQAELAKLRAKQEETRKQVASLSISKLAALNRQNGGSDHDAGDSDDDIIDNPLFVSDEPSKPNDDPLQNSAMPISHYSQADPPTPRRPVGPTTAAAVMAAHIKKATPSYRDKREALDDELARERMAKIKSDFARKNDLLRRRNQQASMPRTSQPARESQEASQPIASVSFPGPNRSNVPARGFNSAAKGKSASQPTPARKRPSIPKGTGLFPSSMNVSAPPATLNLLSDSKHQELLREQKQQAQQNTAKDREKENAKSRKKREEKALEKKRKEIVDNALSVGKEMSEAEINAEVEAFRAKRASDIQKRAENKEKKRLNSAMFPSFAQTQSQLQNPPGTPGLDDDDSEDNSPEGQQRRENMAAVRQNLTATAQDRNYRFNKIASRKTCADFEKDALAGEFASKFQIAAEPYESSEESEEDPDEDPAPPSSHTASNDASDKEDEDMSDESDEEDDYGSSDSPNQRGNLNPDEFDTQMINVLASQSLDAGTQWVNPSPEKQAETLFVYFVWRVDRLNGDNEQSKLIQIFPNHKDANLKVKAILEAFHKQRPTAFNEKYDEVEDLYSGEVYWADDDRETVLVYVQKVLKTKRDMPQFKDVKPRRYPTKFWCIKRIVIELQFDKETGITTELPPKMEILEDENWSDLGFANKCACELFIDFLKPKRIDDARKLGNIATWTNDIQPLLRSESEKCIAAKKPMVVEVDCCGEEGTMPWLRNKFKTIEFIVFSKVMKGPLN